MTVKRGGRETEPKPPRASRWLFWRRERLGEPPARIEANPPAIESETVVAEIVVTELALPGSVVLTRGEPERAWVDEPEEAESAAPHASEAFAETPEAKPPAREWNIWELERRAREQAGDAGRDQEWAALFMHLRQFANADGVLPKQFDGLVRESFSTLIQAA